MAARAIWKGSIEFGAISVPIKLYSAVQEKGVHFRLLDRRTKKPVKQHMIRPDTGDVVEQAETKKALAVDRRSMVILEEEDLEKVDPPASRDIEVLHFYKPEAITHQWFERPYWVGPDGNSKGYFALAAALKKEEREGLAHWVMRKKEYFGALRSTGDHLMLVTLRNAEEVVDPASISAPSGRDLSANEIKMATQLVSAMEGELDMTRFKDEYRERVLEFVEAKAKGKVIRLAKPKEKHVSDDLTAALENIIASTSKERRSA